jgi:hypothetical protein
MSTSTINRDNRPKSAFKITRHEQDQLIDDTADILATMVKSRRAVQEPTVLTPQVNTYKRKLRFLFELNLAHSNVYFTKYQSITTVNIFF